MKTLPEHLHTEYVLWFIAGCLIAGRFISAAITDPSHTSDIFRIFYFDFLIGFIVAVFPFVFFQIFGQYPLQSIREKKDSPRILVQGSGNIVHLEKPKETINNNNYIAIEEGVGLLTQLVINAEELSNKIYRRSGVYLIFGILIAFSGILYFSFQSILVSTNLDLPTLLLTLLPRFGILFFIEFIAFFFLKQYRAAMDEFRHYDSIKRNRESQLALYIIAIRDFKENKFSTVVDKINFFDRIGVLSQGETTETIEASKLNKNEFDSIKDLLAELINKNNKTI